MQILTYGIYKIKGTYNAKVVIYDMNDLTPKQEKFVDEYIISGNATDAYKKAYTTVKNDAVARTNGSRLLSNANVSKKIAERSGQAKDERLLTVEQALILSASIANGEVQKAYVKKTDLLTGEVTKEIETEFTPSIEERQRSLDHIFKVNGAFLERKEISGSAIVTFVDDIGSDLHDN